MHVVSLNVELPDGHNGGRDIIVKFAHMHAIGSRGLSVGQTGSRGVGGGVGGNLILTQPYTTRSSS